tara:strand:- start:798 stop:920 length:123 start_codon:yes stop_codon:yes gene_type:complete
MNKIKTTKKEDLEAFRNQLKTKVEGKFGYRSKEIRLEQPH